MSASATRRELHYGNRMVRCFAGRPNDLDQMFTSAAARRPKAAALVAGDTRLTYADLDAKVASVAANLAMVGFVAGDRLALLVGNRPEYMIAVLAAARAGLIIVPMNIRQRRPEILYMLAHSEAKGLIFEAALAGELPDRAETPHLAHKWAVGIAGLGEHASLETLTAACADPHEPARVREEDPFCILYTSGTTGRPKGAILTHLGLVHSVIHYRDGFGLREGEIAALAVPASHVTGLVAILLAIVGVAGTTVMIETFKARDFLATVEAERIGYTLIVPAMYKLCLMVPEIATRDLSSWRIGGFGGAPMPAATIESLAEAIPTLKLSNIYGATETTSPVTMLSPSHVLSHATTVGQPLPCAEMLVVDEQDRELPPGERGELLIAGPITIPGYWRNAEANEACFADGYWRSGDIASIDQHGFVSIHDRKKDVINRGGYKIYSAEVESVLARHPQVVESGVVGYPCDVLGERVQAVVSIVAGAAVMPEALRLFCASELSDYKVPERFVIVEHPLPRNANGKILKTALRGMEAMPVGQPPRPVNAR